jgi:hypothetical protein
VDLDAEAGALPKVGLRPHRQSKMALGSQLLNSFGPRAFCCFSTVSFKTIRPVASAIKNEY